jgi:hypothetical protein
MDSIKNIKKCTISDGINLCKLMQKELDEIGLFPALTGGLIYKDGQRKDIDIVIYRHRQKLRFFETIDIKKQLESIGIEITGFYGFVTKAKWNGFIVDIFNPETTKDDLTYGDEN